MQLVVCAGDEFMRTSEGTFYMLSLAPHAAHLTDCSSLHADLILTVLRNQLEVHESLSNS